uniref:Uncharacterized protein n=1 Tax=Hyaloperonospora arabidopsidis (strain Emoy2) TaxID=559515 RepID=M4BZK4_HYAAE
MGDLLNKNRAMYQPTKKEVLLQARFLTSQQAQQSIRDYVQEVRSLSASNSVIPIPKCGKADHDLEITIGNGDRRSVEIAIKPTDLDLAGDHQTSICVILLRAEYLASRRQRTSTLLTGRSILELLGQECKDYQQPSTAIGCRQPYWLKYKMVRRLKWSEGSRLKYPIFGTRLSGLIAATLGERQQEHTIG